MSVKEKLVTRVPAFERKLENPQLFFQTQSAWRLFIRKAWIFGGWEFPFEVRGPVGTKKMMTKLEEAFEFDLHVRPIHDLLPVQGANIIAHDIHQGLASYVACPPYPALRGSRRVRRQLRTE